MAGIDWQAVARAETHPLRLRIIELAAADPERRFSAKDLAGEWEASIGVVSHHLKALHADGLLAKAGQTPRRGAVQRYYRAGAKLLA